MAKGAAVSQEPAAPAPSRGARAAVFAQLTGAGRSEQVAQRLTDAILLGVLAPGDRLPSEAELAKRFGVALVTARDGLGAVREAGLVETRRGREGGSFVLATEQTPERLLQARLRGLSHVEIADLAVYFGMLAAGCAERAAELASTDEAQRLTDWPIYWASSDLAAEGYQHVDGAVRMGRATAARILARDAAAGKEAAGTEAAA